MKSFKIILIIFSSIIIIIGGLLFLYKDQLFVFMNKKISYDNRFLFSEHEQQLLEIENKELKQIENIEIIELSKYKRLEENVPSTFINKEISVGQATTSSNFVRQYIFR